MPVKIITVAAPGPDSPDFTYDEVASRQTGPATRAQYRAQRAKLVRIARWRRWQERAEPFTAAQLAAQRLDIDSQEDPDSIGIISEAIFYTRDGEPVAIFAHSDQPKSEIIAFARKWRLQLMLCEGRPTSLMLWRGLL